MNRTTDTVLVLFFYETEYHRRHLIDKEKRLTTEKEHNHRKHSLFPFSPRVFICRRWRWPLEVTSLNLLVDPMPPYHLHLR